MDGTSILLLVLVASAGLCAGLWQMRGGQPLVGLAFGICLGPIAVIYGLLTLGDGKKPKHVRG
jgi:hypothetical protein